MYKNIHNYKPFEHENFEFKNNIITTARNQDKTKVEGIFTAVLIYTNLVDYLSRHLLENLNKMVSIYTFQKFGGVLFFDASAKRNNLPLGELKKELGYFEFPNKKDFIDCLEEFKNLRNQVMHNLMQLDPTDSTQKFDKDLARIAEIAEDILMKYNSISRGITTIWEAAKTE